MCANLACTLGLPLGADRAGYLTSVLLYSSSEAPERERKPDPNTYEPFRVVGDAVGRRLEAFMTEEEEGDAKSGLAGELAWSAAAVGASADQPGLLYRIHLPCHRFGQGAVL